jgi:hypothetical protein
MLSSREEAMLVKRRVAREMQTLAEMCEHTKDCSTQLDMLTPAVRGLFLIAYQGEEHSPRLPVDFDWSIPSSYYRLLRASQAVPDIIPDLVPSSDLGGSEESVSTTPSLKNHHHRIRVSFLSAYFFRHSVGRLLGNMILSLDRMRFHVTIFNARKGRPGEERKIDDLTEKLKASADTWMDLSLIFEKDVMMIRSVHSDVLVFGDLLMDAFTAHLISQRMSPLQVAFWGHPFSAGSTTIDFFISSDGFQEAWTTAWNKSEISSDFYEQTVLMESFSANVLADRAYDLGSSMDDVFIAHHNLGSREAYVNYVVTHGFDLFNRPYQHGWNFNETAVERLHIYTCLQSIMKMHPLFDEIIVGLLIKDPHAVIILLSSLKSKFISQLKLQRRLLDALRRAGADPGRIVLMPQISSVVYSQIVCGADVTLDPVPFGGGVTLSDSIRCNVPFVTSGEWVAGYM